MAPALTASAGVAKLPPAGACFRMINLLEKSRPPVIKPIGGIRMSFTREVIIPPKAAPMITPIAKSIAFPLTANSLNSFHMPKLLLGHDDVDKLIWDYHDLPDGLAGNQLLNSRRG